MKYEIVYLKEKIVAGLVIQTNNNDSNMKVVIGNAWKQFFEGGIYQHISNKLNRNSIGLYTNYENKVNGNYDVMICCEISYEKDVPDDVIVGKIEEGKYAKFVIKGGMEKEVGEFWEKLWKMNLDRKYSYDFEEYIGVSEKYDKEINIYISIN